MFPNTLVFIYIRLALKGQRSNKQINEVLAMGEQATAEHSDQLDSAQRNHRTCCWWSCQSICRCFRWIVWTSAETYHQIKLKIWRLLLFVHGGLLSKVVVQKSFVSSSIQSWHVIFTGQSTTILNIVNPVVVYLVMESSATEPEQFIEIFCSSSHSKYRRMNALPWLTHKTDRLLSRQKPQLSHATSDWTLSPPVRFHFNKDNAADAAHFESATAFSFFAFFHVGGSKTQRICGSCWSTVITLGGLVNQETVCAKYLTWPACANYGTVGLLRVLIRPAEFEEILDSEFEVWMSLKKKTCFQLQITK